MTNPIATIARSSVSRHQILGATGGALLLMSCLWLAQSTAWAQETASISDKPAGSVDVVAVVNGKSITRQMLGQETMRRYGEDVLESMVNKYLILQACKQKNIEITAKDVEDEVQRIAAKFGLSTDRYLQMLQEERQLSPTEYRRDIVWPMLALQHLVSNEIQVSDEEFNQAYLSQYGESVKCRMIMHSNEETIRKLHAQSTSDPSQFGQLAKDFSEDEASASVRGMIPPVHRYTADPAFEAAAFALQPQQVSQPFKVADKWILLQCIKHLPAAHPSATQVASIRQQISDRIRDQKMRGSATDLFQKLQQQAQVVNVHNDAQLRKQYPGAAALINGQQLTLAQLSEECIKRHGEEVLEGEINRTILEQELKKNNLTIEQSDIQTEVARAAETFGFVSENGQPDVAKWMEKVTQAENVTQELYLRDAVWPSVALKKIVDGSIKITEEDLRKGFESNFGQRVEALAIVLSDQKSAQRVWDLARDNPSEEYFMQLAEQYSIEPVSQSNMGRVPPIRRHGGQPAVEDEAFRLKPGELSGIVATGDRYIILRCMGRTEPIVKQMDAQVREQLVADLTERQTRVAMARKFDQLKEGSQIDNYLTSTTQDGNLTTVARNPNPQ